MTREEAIQALEIVKHMESFSMLYEPGEPINQTTVSKLKDACRMVISALCAQQTPAKLDRSRWEGCKYCNDPSIGIWIGHLYKYCPYCGAPQNEEAWAELERRINDGTTD